MIAALCTNHYIGDIDRSVSSASHACRNDKIGAVAVYHLYCANGRIDLAYAALLHHHLIVADTALDKRAPVVCLNLVHSHYYSYSHCYCSVIIVSEMQSYAFLLRSHIVAPTKKRGLAQVPLYNTFSHEKNY